MRVKGIVERIGKIEKPGKLVKGLPKMLITPTTSRWWLVGALAVAAVTPAALILLQAMRSGDALPSNSESFMTIEQIRQLNAARSLERARFASSTSGTTISGEPAQAGTHERVVQQESPAEVATSLTASSVSATPPSQFRGTRNIPASSVASPTRLDRVAGDRTAPSNPNQGAGQSAETNGKSPTTVAAGSNAAGNGGGAVAPRAFASLGGGGGGSGGTAGANREAGDQTGDETNEQPTADPRNDAAANRPSGANDGSEESNTQTASASTDESPNTFADAEDGGAETRITQFDSAVPTRSAGPAPPGSNSTDPVAGGGPDGSPRRSGSVDAPSSTPTVLDDETTDIYAKVVGSVIVVSGVDALAWDDNDTVQVIYGHDAIDQVAVPPSRTAAYTELQAYLGGAMDTAIPLDDRHAENGYVLLRMNPGTVRLQLWSRADSPSNPSRTLIEWSPIVTSTADPAASFD